MTTPIWRSTCELRLRVAGQGGIAARRDRFAPVFGETVDRAAERAGVCKIVMHGLSGRIGDASCLAGKISVSAGRDNYAGFVSRQRAAVSVPHTAAKVADVNCRVERWRSGGVRCRGGHREHSGRSGDCGQCCNQLFHLRRPLLEFTCARAGGSAGSLQSHTYSQTLRPIVADRAVRGAPR